MWRFDMGWGIAGQCGGWSGGGVACPINAPLFNPTVSGTHVSLGGCVVLFPFLIQKLGAAACVRVFPKIIYPQINICPPPPPPLLRVLVPQHLQASQVKKELK